MRAPERRTSSFDLVVCFSPFFVSTTVTQTSTFSLCAPGGVNKRAEKQDTVMYSRHLGPSWTRSFN